MLFTIRLLLSLNFMEPALGRPYLEGRQRRQRLYELEHVVPLSVQDELAEEEEVVGEGAVDHASLPLKGDLGKNVQ